MTMKQTLLASCFVTLLSAAPVSAVPLPPTNLTAVVSGDTISIFFNAPPGPILAFQVLAGLTPGGTIAGNFLAPNPSSVLNGFVATPIPPGTYYLRVHAIDATGISAPSNEAIAVVGSGACTAPPVAPIGVGASVVGSLATVIWAPGIGGCPATNYSLHAGSAPGLSNIAVANVGPTLTLSAVAPPGTYFVRIFAQNAFGSSAASTEIVVVVGAGDRSP
jgi:hypothetical protein